MFLDDFLWLYIWDCYVSYQYSCLEQLEHNDIIAYLFTRIQLSWLKPSTCIYRTICLFHGRIFEIFLWLVFFPVWLFFVRLACSKMFVIVSDTIRNTYVLLTNDVSRRSVSTCYYFPKRHNHNFSCSPITVVFLSTIWWRPTLRTLPGNDDRCALQQLRRRLNKSNVSSFIL